MYLPMGILALSYRAIANRLDITKRSLDKGSCRRIKADRAIVAYAFGDLFAQLNAELIKRVNPQQNSIHERPMLVKGN